LEKGLERAWTETRRALSL